MCHAHPYFHPPPPDGTPATAAPAEQPKRPPPSGQLVGRRNCCRAGVGGEARGTPAAEMVGEVGDAWVKRQKWVRWGRGRGRGQAKTWNAPSVTFRFQCPTPPHHMSQTTRAPARPLAAYRSALLVIVLTFYLKNSLPPNSVLVALSRFRNAPCGVPARECLRRVAVAKIPFSVPFGLLGPSEV